MNHEAFVCLHRALRGCLIVFAVGVAAASVALAEGNNRGGGRGGGRGNDPPAAPEAPAGFDGRTNGLVSQSQFDLDLEIFDEQEAIDEGLGPVFNARSCGECHGNPVSGAISQVTELRVGKFSNNRFTEHPGGSLIHDRAIDPSLVERTVAGYTVMSLRTSLNTLGDGFVESIADSTIEGIASRQPGSVRGTVIKVPVLEANGALRVARFGWKNQHASLVSFSADAYLNEMGITSPFAPVENTSNGRAIDDFDDVPDPEEPPTAAEPAGPDIEAFARFMRATKVPPRDVQLAGTAEARRGERVFANIGCASCHVTTIVTAAPGTVINGGKFTVPAALGNKTIHPYSDFLLHDVGTGDGIVQNGGPATRNMLRTPPLWGLRTRGRLMHDGASMSRPEAIMRHAGQASASATQFIRLSSAEKADLLVFLDSL